MLATRSGIIGRSYQFCAAAIHTLFRIMVSICALLLVTSPAAAQTITGATQSTSTYSGAGQTITYTVTVNSGSKVASSATVASPIGVVYSCPIADTVNTGVTFTCTGTYTTTATDVSSLQVQERATVTLLSFATPTIMTGPILTATYVAPPPPVAAPTVTALSPGTGPAAGGTSVAITGTNFTGVTGVSFGSTAASSFTVNSTTSITATSPAGTGTVNVRVANAGGTSATGAANQFVYAAAAVAPAITGNPSSATVTAGATASFTASASGTPTPTVQWEVSSDNGGSFSNVSSATSTTLSFAAAAGDNGKQYRAVFTNSAGTATTTAATLTVQTPPVITTQPVGATVAPGQGITMLAAATGTPTPSAQWLFSEDNGATFANLTNSLSFTLVSPTAKTALVKVVFTNSAGSVTSDTVTLVWVKQNQTISFTSAAPTTAVFGGPTYSVTATATSGLGVTYTIDASASSVCSVAGSTVSFIGVGTCTINANQAGNTAFNAAPQVQQSFAVGQGANVITFGSTPSSPVVGGPTYNVTATATSGLTVSFAIDASASGICSISGSAVSFLAAGTCTINANQAGNANYSAAAQMQQSFTVGQGSNVITFPPLGDTPFTSAPPTLAATASSGLAISYASNSTGVCTVTGGAISFVAVGTCSINASQAGDANFTAATSVSQTFAVTPGANTITFGVLPDRALGSGSFALTATASSGLAVSYAGTTAATCSVSGSTVSLLAVGTCSITATQAGDGNYAAATPIIQSFQITQAVTTVGLTSSASTAFFGMPITLTATVSGSSPTGMVRFNDGATVLGTSALNGGTASFTTSTLTAGAHQLTAAYLGDASNMPGTSVAVSVTVNARPNPAQDPDTRSSVDSQFRTAERFVRTQIDNVGDRLSDLHSDDGGRNNIDLRITQTRRQLRNGIPGSGLGVQSDNTGYGYRGGQPVSGGEAMMAALNPDAPWLPGAPLGMAPVAMGSGSDEVSDGTVQAAGDSLERRAFRIWASGDVNFGKEQPNGAIEQRFTSTGITVGIDGDVSTSLKLGAAFGFAWDHTRIGTNGSENNANNASLTFYGSWRAAPKLFIDGLVGMGYGTIDTTRFSTTGTVFLDGKRRTGQTFAALIGTYEAKLGEIEFAPYLRADGIWVHLSPYTETGSPYWALAFQEADENSFSGTVGAKSRFPLDKDGKWKLSAKAEYRTRISGDYTQLLDYADIQGAQGTPYAITGQGVNSSTFTGGLGIEGNLHRLLLRLNYDLTTLAGGNVRNGISAALAVKF